MVSNRYTLLLYVWFPMHIYRELYGIWYICTVSVYNVSCVLIQWVTSYVTHLQLAY